MKRNVKKLLSLGLVLLMCLQVLLGAGLFTLTASAASFNVPSKPSSSPLARSNTTLAHGNSIYCYTSVGSTAFSNYLTTMRNSGYTQVASRTIGSVQTYAFSHAAGTAYVVYSGRESSMYLALDNRSVTSSWAEKTSYTTVTEPTMANMSQDRAITPLADGNGMDYIFTLADGSYLILDGGYGEDAERIYNFLLDNNKRTDGKIVIHAWYITHGHGDHFGAFKKFATNHGADVTLENVIAYAAASTDPLYTELTTYLPYFGKNVKLIRPHTGDYYKMPGLTMEIMYTADDLYMYNGTIDASNNMSTVCKVTIGGQTILFTGDAAESAVAKMLKMYTTTQLQATFFQVNHHGNSGGTAAFYTAVAPTYLLFTSSQSGTELRINNKMYQWIASSVVTPQYDLANSVGGLTNIFAQDGPVEIFTFPYDGNREGLATYLVDDTVRTKDPSVAYEVDISELAAPGTYTASQLAAMTGWGVPADSTGATYQITSDGKLRIQLPFQTPGTDFDATTGRGTPSMNGEQFLRFSNGLSHFRDGRTVIEFEMTYNESVIARNFTAPIQISNTTASGQYWYEAAVRVDGQIESRYRYNTDWQFLDSYVAATDVPYNRLTTDYSTNSSFQYPGYVVSDNYQNFSGTGGVYTSNLTKHDNTIFGSTDRYKIVVDPYNGIDLYVNDVLVSSTQTVDVWQDTIYDAIIGTRVGLRLMPGVDITLGNIKIYREDAAPSLLITEVAPKGADGAGTWASYFEVYNNSTSSVNIYDYAVLRDSNPGVAAKWDSSFIWKILPGSTTWVATKNSANTVTHTNPDYADGWLAPGESALLWVPYNSMRNVASTIAGNGKTVADFRSTLQLSDDQKVFVAYNNDNRNITAGSNGSLYGIGHAGFDYLAAGQSGDDLFGNLVSYVYHNNSKMTSFTDSNGTQKFAQENPVTTAAGNGSIRYYYPNNNQTRKGILYLAETDVATPGVIEAAQKRQDTVTVQINGVEQTVPVLLDLTSYLSDPDVEKTVRLTAANGDVIETSETVVSVSEGMQINIYEGSEGISYLWREDFSGYSPVSYVDKDVTVSGSTYTTNNAKGDVKMNQLLGWKHITGTDGAEYEITSDGKLRIYNPYYAVSQRSSSTSYETKNYDIQIEIGKFPAMVGQKVVLEYDFQYNDRGAAGTSAANFTIGKFIDQSSYCFSPQITAQGFYRAQVGAKALGSVMTDQVRPEWIPYTQKSSGYDFTYGPSNHYNIFGGVNHVKIEIDPYNGMMVSVNGVMISMVQNTDTWESLYDQYMGELLGLSVSGGMEVVLDNIELYTVKDVRPELIITEVGNAMGTYEYIEVYNNSDRVLDIYDYQLMRDTNLGTVGTTNGAPSRWTTANIGTIKRGTHTYTASGSTQSVTLTNPEDGSLAPGQTAILWIPSNTTYVNGSSAQEEETLEMFMNNYGLTDSSKIFATYNNDNLALYDGSNLAYGIGYADVDYTTHNSYALNELVSYVYVNTTNDTIYGVNVGITKQAATLASIEYKYDHNNGVKQGTFLSSVAGQKTPGAALDAQKRKTVVYVNGQRYETNLGEAISVDSMLQAVAIDTLTGASIRTNDPTGMRWMTAINAEDYAMVKSWLEQGLITNVEIGTIIIRTEDLAGRELTLDLVNNVNCFAVKATDTAWYEETPTIADGYAASLVGTHIFAGSVSNIYQSHYNVKYSAVGYLAVTLTDGTVQAVYGGYQEDEHSRTVAEVAYRALQDPNSGLSTAEKEVLTGFAAFYEAN